MISISNYNTGSSSSAGGSGITTLQAGPGIGITNTEGPTSTITNTGVLSLVGGHDINTTDNADGTWTIDYVPTSPWELESATANTLTLNSSATNALYNPAVNVGDQVISAQGTINTEKLVLTTQSSTTNLVRVEKNKVVMAVGGTSINGTDRIALDQGALNFVSTGTIDMEADILDVEMSQNVVLNGGTSVSVSGNSVVLTGTTISMNGNVNFNTICTTTATMPSTSDNSTKIPTTAWVQSVYGEGQQKTLVSATYLGEIVTIPAGVLYVDVIVISRGGQAGAKVGAYWGGTGGGGTTCTLNTMLVREGQKFKFEQNAGSTAAVLSYSIPNSVTPTTFDIMATVPHGGNGGIGSIGGAAAGAVGADPTLTTAYGNWHTRKGSTGTAVAAPGTTEPTTAGSPAGRPFVLGEDGCGETKDVNPTNRGKGVLYLVYYYV